MNIKLLKTKLYEEIINDFNKNKAGYMFYLSPIIFKLKTKDFKNYKYSLFSKIKNKELAEFKNYKLKKYLKKDYEKDLKTIIKIICKSDYIDENNKYALHYIKKLVKRPSKLCYINLIYRLLTDINKKTGGKLNDYLPNFSKLSFSVFKKRAQPAEPQPKPQQPQDEPQPEQPETLKVIDTFKQLKLELKNTTLTSIEHIKMKENLKVIKNNAEFTSIKYTQIPDLNVLNRINAFIDANSIYHYTIYDYNFIIFLYNDFLRQKYIKKIVTMPNNEGFINVFNYSLDIYNTIPNKIHTLEQEKDLAFKEKVDITSSINTINENINIYNNLIKYYNIIFDEIYNEPFIDVNEILEYQKEEKGQFREQLSTPTDPDHKETIEKFYNETIKTRQPVGNNFNTYLKYYNINLNIYEIINDDKKKYFEYNKIIVQYNNYLKNYYLKKLNDLIITNSTLDRQISKLEDIDISDIDIVNYNEHIRECNQIISSTFDYNDKERIFKKVMESYFDISYTNIKNECIKMLYNINIYKNLNNESVFKLIDNILTNSEIDYNLHNRLFSNILAIVKTNNQHINNDKDLKKTSLIILFIFYCSEFYRLYTDLYNIVDSNKYTLNIQKLINKLASILQKEDDTMFDTISHICYKTYLYYLNIIYKLEPKIKLAQQAKVEFGKYKLIKHGIDEKIKENLETVDFNSTFQKLYEARLPLDTKYLNKEHSIELAIFKLFNIDECILFNDDERNMNYYDILEIYRYMNCLYIDKISKLKTNKDTKFDIKIAIPFLNNYYYLENLCKLIDSFNISSLDYDHTDNPETQLSRISDKYVLSQTISNIITEFNKQKNFYNYLTKVENISNDEFIMNLIDETNIPNKTTKSLYIYHKIYIYYDKYILDYNLKYILEEFIKLYIKEPASKSILPNKEIWRNLYNTIITQLNLTDFNNFIQYIKDNKEQSFQNKLAILLKDRFSDYFRIKQSINIGISRVNTALPSIQSDKPRTTTTLGGNGQLNNDKLQLLLSYIFKHIKTIEC